MNTRTWNTVTLKARDVLSAYSVDARVRFTLVEDHFAPASGHMWRACALPQWQTFIVCEQCIDLIVYYMYMI